MHLIDTHAHLDFTEFDPDRTQVLVRAAEAGVQEIISIGTRIDSSTRAVELAESFPSVWATVGVHPSEAQTAPENFTDELRRLASNSRVVALGEIGLDYHHLPSEKNGDKPQDIYAVTVSEDPAVLTAKIADGDYKNQQAIVFREQLDLAVDLGLNVVIHQRDSWDDTLAILQDYTGKLRGVFHCFGGTPDQAAQLIELGHLVSFTGIVTFKNARQAQESVQAVPLNKFMVETDCPYLAPVPNRGKRCESAYTRIVAEHIAALRGIPFNEVAEATTTTAREFFNFKRAA